MSASLTDSFFNGSMPCQRLNRAGPVPPPRAKPPAKHDTRTGPGWNGHGGLRAGPGLGHAKACRAMGYVSGRPGLDMYTNIHRSGFRLVCLSIKYDVGLFYVINHIITNRNTFL